MGADKAYPPVSVVIRTFNVAPWIGETLAAVRSQDYPGEVEVLVVDSGSSDRTQVIAATFSARVLCLPFPFTFGGALNFGDAAAQHSLLVHLSADATPAHAGYLRALVSPLLEEGVAATFGRDLSRPWASPSQARDQETWFPAERGLDPAQRFSNANACIRKEVLAQFPFDESLPGTEDLEWARRVLHAGYRIVYVPEATTLHTHSRSLHQVFQKARLERAALRSFSPDEAAFPVWAALRFWVGLSLLDMKYAVSHRYPLRQWFHPWAFRAAQALGLYQGAHRRDLHTPGL